MATGFHERWYGLHKPKSHLPYGVGVRVGEGLAGVGLGLEETNVAGAVIIATHRCPDPGA